MKILATYSIKGGVGKTTAAVNLGYEAGRSGARVLVWDLDPQGAATFFFRVKAKLSGGSKRLVGRRGELIEHVRATDLDGVHLVPADLSLRHLDLHLDDTKRPTERLRALLEPVEDRYDVAVLDCAPSISLGSESVFAASDALLVPVVPTTLSKRTLDQLEAFLAPLDPAPEVMPFFSMVDRRKRLHRELLTTMAADHPSFLPTIVPSATAVERMGVERGPVAAVDPRSPATRAFAALWCDVATRLWG